MNDFEARIDRKLKIQASKNLSRSLRVMPPGLRDFTSNDYLGFARSKVLAQRVHQLLDSTGAIQNGSGGSRLLSGNSQVAEDTENFLARVCRADSALLFNSGYMANVGVLSTVPQRGDVILYDEHVHASIKDGIRLSLAQAYSFRHNDPDDLKKKLMKGRGMAFIVVESVYSMDGDECNLREIVQLASSFNAVVILDEANSTGVYGTGGGGMALAQGLQDEIAVRIMTFGKAMGAHGACVCGSGRLRDLLVNFSRPFIYTTALPAHSVATIRCSFEYLAEHDDLPGILRDKIALFKTHLGERIASKSAIQPMIVPGNDNARAAAAHLQSIGFDARPVLSPTVKEGTERLRICLHVFNDDEDVIRLATELNQLEFD